MLLFIFIYDLLTYAISSDYLALNSGVTNELER
jgi:hypothetical protein